MPHYYYNADGELVAQSENATGVANDDLVRAFVDAFDAWVRAQMYLPMRHSKCLFVKMIEIRERLREVLDE